MPKKINSNENPCSIPERKVLMEYSTIPALILTELPRADTMTSQMV